MTIKHMTKTTDYVPKSVCTLALISMVICGLGYRVAAHRLSKSNMPAVVLPVSLKTFPLAISGWTGTDVPLDETVVEAAGDDDFCNRLYKKKEANYWANVYIAYSAQPRTMIGHRPDVCYVGAGWIHDSTETSSFVSKTGNEIPCLIHRFHLPRPRSEEIVVLNFYVINGKPTAKESGFSGITWRTPNIKGDIAHYVAQIQISSILENMVRDAAADMADQILNILPRDTDANDAGLKKTTDIFERDANL